MRAFRNFCRDWAFVCALVFLPWTQATATQVDILPASCCADMPAMAGMSMPGAAEQTALAGHDHGQVERAFCQAACQDLSAATVANPSRDLQVPHAALFLRAVRVLQPEPARAFPHVRQTDLPRLSKPPFLAVRLLV
ncbi:hypothetical protein [Thiomonas delicata]|jgi:hypothetical protein|uniref:Uncharacterized protein n=1 Tax=Thiomonas delicata TaxID=364030 RepID=A0A238D3T8_THIDL|nr:MULTISPECIES: hypothetical protein [Thiomonas]SBP87966.1 conserved exported hypothetical protein [Thiomonas delicata]